MSGFGENYGEDYGVVVATVSAVAATITTATGGVSTTAEVTRTVSVTNTASVTTTTGDASVTPQINRTVSVPGGASVATTVGDVVVDTTTTTTVGVNPASITTGAGSAGTYTEIYRTVSADSATITTTTGAPAVSTTLSPVVSTNPATITTSTGSVTASSGVGVAVEGAQITTAVGDVSTYVEFNNVASVSDAATITTATGDVAVTPQITRTVSVSTTATITTTTGTPAVSTQISPIISANPATITTEGGPVPTHTTVSVTDTATITTATGDAIGDGGTPTTVTVNSVGAYATTTGAVDAGGYTSIDIPVSGARIETATGTARAYEAFPNTVSVDDVATITTPTGGANVEIRYPTRIVTDPAEIAMIPGTVYVEGDGVLRTIPGAIKGVVPTASVEASLSPSIDLDSVPSVEPSPANHHQRDYLDPDRETFVQPQRDPIITEDETVYTPDRRVYINDNLIEVDRDINVTAGEYGFALAEVTLYNLDARTWADINENDHMKIELGWAQGSVHRVFDGYIRIKRRRHKLHNRAYILRARARGADILTSKINRTYNNMSPHRIVEHLSVDVDGLDRGYISTDSDRLGGAYTISRSKELSDWFDKLAKRATRQTGERWVWYIHNGNISFHPIKEQVTEPVGLSMDKSVIRATPSGSIDDDPSLQRYEIVTRCESVIRRGMVVTIGGANGINERSLHRVAEYSQDSSTTTGRHHTTATIEPMRKKITYPQ